MFHDIRLIALAGVVAAGAPMAALAQTATPSDQEVLARALSAAPPQMRQESTVVAADGRVLQRGVNDFTCMLGGPPGADPAPMCLDSVFMGWAEQWLAGNRSYGGPTGVGLAYMLAGDALTGGASTTDPFATGATADNAWVVEGPHVMIVAPDEGAYAHLPATSTTGGPYVMWRGTPYAHIMMPVGPRETSRQQAYAPALDPAVSPAAALPPPQSFDQISEVPVGFQFRDPRGEF